MRNKNYDKRRYKPRNSEKVLMDKWTAPKTFRSRKRELEAVENIQEINQFLMEGDTQND